MTNDEIVARGALAARYLADADLMAFFNDMKADIQTALFHTAPAQANARDALYYQHKGLTEVLDTMAAYKNKAEEIIESRTQIVNSFYDD